MLKQLRIHNIILIENSDIHFEAGLNVLSGETGSGKSAIMEALKLVLGERADSGLIRHGCEKGVVEALFEIETLPEELLAQGGIEFSAGEGLLIRREIYFNGKSRAFINNQMAQLSFLRTLGDALIDVIGQHANQRLRTTEKHREFVDIFGDLDILRASFHAAWIKETKIQEELSQLVANESHRLREIEVCRMELEELREANMKEGEDERLFSEYALLSSCEERMQKVSELTKMLSEDKNAVLTLLKRYQGTFENLVRADTTLSPVLESYASVCLELEEVAHTLRTYQGRIDFNPAKTEKIHERLSEINRLKKKYGTTLQEIVSYQAEREARLQQLENADIRIEDLRKELDRQKNEVNHLAKELTDKRCAAARQLEDVLVKQLRSLNMPKVEFYIQITPQKRCSTGDDKVEFFLSPNVGENRISLCESASGGELSRFMLAMQTVLAGKAKIPTLVFDEIDANIGGETATVIGEKLKEIGARHQVLCITHFSQVAVQAHHHIQISKREIEGRTITVVTLLNAKMRQKELLRMQGKK